MALLHRALPFKLSRLALAGWAWRNRDEVTKWARFGADAVTRVGSGETDDVKTEARVRAALSRDPRTRNARGLEVKVHDGVAHLEGTVPAHVADAAREIVERTGVRRVRDGLRHERRRGRARLRPSRA
jgi:osmotically-inducible protein OsmY